MNTATEQAATAPAVRVEGTKLTVGKQSVKLGAGEAILLGTLLLNCGATINRRELETAMYGATTPIKSNVVEVLMGRIRRKLKALGQAGVIETVRLKGYRFAREHLVVS